jgi:mannose PTS system EIIA component
MVGVLIVAHAPLGDAMLLCVQHVFGQRPDGLVAVDVLPDGDPAALARQLRELLTLLNDGSGVLVLTDIIGSTPSNIASSLAQDQQASVLTGVNLPMLLRALNHRNLPLEELTEKVMLGGRNAILNTRVTAPQQQTITTGDKQDAANRSSDQ